MRWNQRVGNLDTVYHLGDFTLGGYKEFKSYLSRLNGDIRFVPGGHDFRWFGYVDRSAASWDGIPPTILPPMQNIEIAQEKYPLVIVLCHYAMRVWDRSHYGSLHLYGHSHGRLHGLGRSMDVGVDCHAFYPIRLDRIIDQLLAIPKHDNPKGTGLAEALNA